MAHLLCVEDRIMHISLVEDIVPGHMAALVARPSLHKPAVLILCEPAKKRQVMRRGLELVSVRRRAE